MVQEFIYKIVNDCEMRAVLFPVEQSNQPLLIYIHGGGLIWGSPDDLAKEQVKIYNDAGYNVLSIAYRLAPETKLPQIIEDVEDALKWVYNEGAKEIDFNSEKVAVIGSSAGGYLALLTGTFAIKPKAIISFYGYGDILGDWYKEPSAHFNTFPTVKKSLAEMLIKSKEISEASIFTRYAIYLYCRQQGEWLHYTNNIKASFLDDELIGYCPLSLIDESYPPTMLLHGDEDEDVPYEESQKMKRALDEKQIKNTFITIQDGKHSFDKHMHDDQVKQAFNKVLEFLKETL